jgi:phosphatidylserine/phosphatidylglycerophosphate/cardiolipin synthase-like enzyme
MMLKNLEGRNLIPILFIRFLLDAMPLGFSLIKLNFRRFRALIHAYFCLLFHPGMIRRKRKEVEALRTVNDREIFRLMHPKSIAMQYFFGGKKPYRDVVK